MLILKFEAGFEEQSLLLKLSINIGFVTTTPEVHGGGSERDGVMQRWLATDEAVTRREELIVRAQRKGESWRKWSRPRRRFDDYDDGGAGSRARRPRWWRSRTRRRREAWFLGGDLGSNLIPQRKSWNSNSKRLHLNSQVRDLSYGG